MRRRFDKLLVLDLDETLIHASMFSQPWPHDFQVGLARAWKRPGVGRFLTICFEWFHVGIWTSATRPYAGDVLGHLAGDPGRFSFVFTREHCLQKDIAELPGNFGNRDPALGQPAPNAGWGSAGLGRIWVKDLCFLLERGQSVESIIVVDDSPESWLGHQDNVVAVSKFKGDPADRELELLLPFLESLGQLPDIRAASQDR